MTDLELVRMTLGDQLKSTADRDKGDGTTTIFALSHEHVQDVTVTVDGNPVGQPDDYTADLSNGEIIFDTAPENLKEVRVEYKFAAFNDAELQEIYALEGSVSATVVRCIKILMADAARRTDYTHGQTSVSASQVFSNLNELLRVHTQSNSNTPRIVTRSNPYYAGRKDRKLDLSRADLGADGWRNP